ncbi:MAG: hypothetical protein RR676_12820 [Acinetobacter sp.]
MVDIDKNVETFVLEADKKIYRECLVLNSLKLKTGLFAKYLVKQDYYLVSMNRVQAEKNKKPWKCRCE